MGNITNAYRIIGKYEGKRSCGRPRSRWEDNIRMDLRETGWEGVDWMHLIQDEGPAAGNEPLGSIKGGEFLE
jgi:hypothetical protein